MKTLHLTSTIERRPIRAARHVAALVFAVTAAGCANFGRDGPFEPHGPGLVVPFETLKDALVTRQNLCIGMPGGIVSACGGPPVPPGGVPPLPLPQPPVKFVLCGEVPGPDGLAWSCAAVLDRPGKR